MTVTSRADAKLKCVKIDDNLKKYSKIEVADRCKELDLHKPDQNLLSPTVKEDICRPLIMVEGTALAGFGDDFGYFCKGTNPDTCVGNCIN